MDIRPMRAGEMGFAIDLAAKEGWDPGLSDALCFHRIDPEGFLVGEVAGEPVGCISAVRYGDDFGFVGLFIVREELRGRGYGSAIWDAGTRRLEGRVVGLDAVLKEQERYARFGFCGAYSNVRYAWEAGAGDLSPSGAAGTDAASPPLDIRPAAQIAGDGLHAYDRRCFPAPRARFVDCWIAMPNCRALAAERDGRLRGYGVIRPCRSGHKIGPLFADGAPEALALCGGLVVAVPKGETVYLDVPEVNTAAVALAEALGMREVFRTVRMYRGPQPAIALASVFGVTSLELG